jgi:hypothetical protein
MKAFWCLVMIGCDTKHKDQLKVSLLVALALIEVSLHQEMLKILF